jgi:competence protein ComEC
MKKVLIAFLILIAGCANTQSGTMSAVFFDVGQGDSSLLITPDSRLILIDCGKDRSAADYLKEMNITSIDVLIKTHPDNDHTGGCIYVEESVNVSRILTNKNVKEDFFLEISDSAVLKVIVAYDSRGRFRNDNDNSVLLKAKHGKISFLFAGDCGWKCESEIGRTEDIDTDILKVGHHGSRYSSTAPFLEKASPSAAVISSGKNSYGHPHNKTLERLESTGADVYRTDTDGTIIITTDGDGYTVQ